MSWQGLGGLLRRSWVDGSEERILETFPEDPFETVKAMIVGGDERQEVGVSRGMG